MNCLKICFDIHQRSCFLFFSGAAGEDELQREIKSWAAQLRSDAWNYGKCEDSVVILVSRDDDAVRTAGNVYVCVSVCEMGWGDTEI